MSEFLGTAIYVLLVSVHMPWLLFALRHGVLERYPLVFFLYLGILTQNVGGSIFVIFPDLAARADYFSATFVAMLLVQLAVFLVLSTAYMWVDRRAPLVVDISPIIDWAYLLALWVLVAAIAWLYVTQVGTPPVVKAVLGELSGADLIQYRIQLTYGLEDYSLYHVGITVLPTLIAAYATGFALATNGRLLYAMVPAAVAVASFPGGKGSIVDVVSAAAVAFVMARFGMAAGAKGRVAWGRLALFLAAFMVPIVLMYRIYYADRSSGEIAVAIIYRLFGVNSESFAAAASYVSSVGELEGASLPTIRGLLQHEYVNLAQEMHLYMFGPGGGAPISGIAEGYVNFGWLGFVVFAVVAVSVVCLYDAILARLPRNFLTFSVAVLLCVFATKVAQLSLVATFVSLTYASLFALLYLLRAALSLSLSSVRVAMGNLAARSAGEAGAGR